MPAGEREHVPRAMAASERGIGQLDIELVRTLLRGERGIVGMLSCGDSLSETRDRSQTAFAQLARLGTTLVTELMGAAENLTPAALREWMGELLDVVNEMVRSECDALAARVKGDSDAGSNHGHARGPAAARSLQPRSRARTRYALRPANDLNE